MALGSLPPCHRVFIVGHSNVQGLQHFCSRRGVINLSFPSWFEIGWLTLTGACMGHLEAEKAAILEFKS